MICHGRDLISESTERMYGKIAEEKGPQHSEMNGGTAGEGQHLPLQTPMDKKSLGDSALARTGGKKKSD